MKLQNFEIIEKLGEGAYSQVYKVKRTIDQQIYALKKVNLTNLSLKEKENALNEVRIIASIRHPNVVSFKESFLSDDGEFLYLVMEYADDGDVLEKIKKHIRTGTRLREDYIWSVFIQSVKGLQVLHSLNIYHRDIKNANLFLYKDGTTKIGDFNVSKQAKMGLLYTQTGTPYYASPEVWSDQPYTSSSDIWSLGCVLYELATLSPPFNGESMKELYGKIMSGVYKKISPKYSLELSNMVSNMLQIDPKKRFSCSQILQLPYIQKKISEKRILSREEEEKSTLLKTIQFKPVTASLQENLPQPNYPNSYHSKSVKKIVNEFLENQDDNNNNESSFCLQPSPSIKLAKEADSSASPLAKKQQKINYSKKGSLIPSLREIKAKKSIPKNERSLDRSSRSKISIQIDNQIDTDSKKNDNSFIQNEEANLSIQIKKKKNNPSENSLQKKEYIPKDQQFIKENYKRGRSPNLNRNVKIQEEYHIQEKQKDNEGSLNEKRKRLLKENSFNHQLSNISSPRDNHTRGSNHSQDQSSISQGKNIFLPILYQNKQFLSSSNSPPASRLRQEAITRKLMKDMYAAKVQEQNKIRSLDKKKQFIQIEIEKNIRLMPQIQGRNMNQSTDSSSERQKTKNSSKLERLNGQFQIQKYTGLSSIEEKKEDNQIQDSQFYNSGLDSHKKSLQKQKSIENEKTSPQSQIKSYKRYNNIRDSQEQQLKLQQNSFSPNKQKDDFHLPLISKSSVLQNYDTNDLLQPHKSINRIRIPTNLLKKIDLEEQQSQQTQQTKKTNQVLSLQDSHNSMEVRNNINAL
ncbi:plant dual-specificity MAP kinase kinase family domain protein (macronuclear) [Tetrahymena thermophila SB210]|uniref:non-specific serine/threonine protein kinase n=1 Tax=Tetrahymena thermophila (strain SB210) TaxID=312017 RepID=Q22F28_TETTS|nr:plant dual-specificity MAP kinase kinase family domain protein [Tetrahymena thermophila SB210]EAR83847.1 plant dual-specificity MAP kinase kinase family domain protein [Tetrahymena thermophila SB210]|eukprot:XP_001031510.1 plant dual-specificity MAP kinase kinase family domain protein [Tetrahymena thermophila SB210]